jgi:flagellar motor protein MotB
MPKAEESKPPESPLWMLTFTDAMTNMLTFFILMLTFSSFYVGAHAQAGGMGPRGAGKTPLPKKTPPAAQAMVESPASPRGEVPDAGSEKPTYLEEPGNASQRPREPMGLLGADAYDDRKVFYIPSRLVFYGWGSRITDSGEDRLNRIAEFLKTDQSSVIVGESSDHAGNHPRFGKGGVGVERAYAVMQHLTGKANIPAGRVAIAAEAAVPEGRYTEPVLEITVLSRSVSP